MKRWAVLICLVGTAQAQQWSRLELADRPITVTASGIVTSANPLRFGPPPNRSWRITITKIAREGTRVQAGDVLATFDASATDDRVRSLTGDLNAKRSELESLFESQAREIEEEKVTLAEARSQADKARRKAEGNAELFASLEYAKLTEERRFARDQYARQQARGELTARVRNVKQAELEADIRRLESELSGAQKELASFTIRAPREGLVIVGTNREGQKLDINEGVNPGMVVVELADADNLVVQAEVPEYVAASLAVGQPASVVIDAVGSNDLAGRVTAVASIVRRQSRFSQAMVRDATIALDDAGAVALLRPGMSAKINLTVDIQKSALAVPGEALQYRDGKPGLLVRGDGWRAVQLGRSSGGLRIVSAGVEAGVEVAVR